MHKENENFEFAAKERIYIKQNLANGNTKSLCKFPNQRKLNNNNNCFVNPTPVLKIRICFLILSVKPQINWDLYF